MSSLGIGAARTGGRCLRLACMHTGVAQIISVRGRATCMGSTCMRMRRMHACACAGREVQGRPEALGWCGVWRMHI
jgi:hypothetical protein